MKGKWKVKYSQNHYMKFVWLRKFCMLEMYLQVNSRSEHVYAWFYSDFFSSLPKEIKFSASMVPYHHYLPPTVQKSPYLFSVATLRPFSNVVIWVWLLCLENDVYKGVGRFGTGSFNGTLLGGDSQVADLLRELTRTGHFLKQQTSDLLLLPWLKIFTLDIGCSVYFSRMVWWWAICHDNVDIFE